MSEDEKADGKKKPRSMVLINVVVSSVLGFICGGLGFAVFSFLSGTTDTPVAEAKEVDAAPVFIPFGELVVNLGDARMSRYLRLNITLQVDGEDEVEATESVESNKAILRNWLLGYLSDLQMEDIRGAAGQNRIRRDVQNYFNEILAPDGFDVVEDILFEEFTVQ